MTLKDALIAANLAGGSGGSGSGGGNVGIMSAYVENTEGYEGGFYKEDDTLYTYEELVALYESGATLMAYSFMGAVVKVDIYDDGAGGYEISANVPSLASDMIYNVYIDQIGYDNGLTEMGVRPFVVEFTVNGSPSSLTGTDIFVPNATHSQIIGNLRRGISVIGHHYSDTHQSGVRILQYEGADESGYEQLYFRDCRPVHDGASGGHMEDLLIVVRVINGETHTESYFYQYALPAYNP